MYPVFWYTFMLHVFKNVTYVYETLAWFVWCVSPFAVQPACYCWFQHNSASSTLLNVNLSTSPLKRIDHEPRHHAVYFPRMHCWKKFQISSSNKGKRELFCLTTSSVGKVNSFRSRWQIYEYGTGGGGGLVETNWSIRRKSSSSANFVHSNSTWIDRRS